MKKFIFGILIPAMLFIGCGNLANTDITDETTIETSTEKEEPVITETSTEPVSDEVVEETENETEEVVPESKTEEKVEETEEEIPVEVEDKSPYEYVLDESVNLEEDYVYLGDVLFTDNADLLNWSYAHGDDNYFVLKKVARVYAAYTDDEHRIAYKDGDNLIYVDKVTRYELYAKIALWDKIKCQTYRIENEYTKLFVPNNSLKFGEVIQYQTDVIYGITGCKTVVDLSWYVEKE